MNRLETIPQHFLQRCQQCADKIALRQKDLGIWREFTWRQSYEESEACALGLLALGVERGMHVATVGDNDRQYLWLYMGLLAIGCVQVGMFTDAIPSEMAYIIAHSDSTMVFAKDQEQVDKLYEIRDQIPKVIKVVFWEERGLWNYDDPWLMSYEELTALGRDKKKEDPQRIEKEILQGKADDLCIICYTSGTTGLPKGAMLPHGNLVKVTQAFQAVDPRLESDNHVSLLPLGWIAEHGLGVAPHVVSGVIMNFPEEPETVRQNVREIAPEGILYNSRLWDSLVGLVQVRINDSTWLNRKLFEWFLPIGYRAADKRLRNEPLGLGLSLLNKIGDLTVFGPLRDQLGLSQVRSAYTAGAALSPDAVRFFHALGVNLKQIYGSTEVTGGATLHYDNDIKFASVGKPAPGIKVRISEEGEIQIGGDTVFVGYYKNPEKTAEDVIVEADGTRWFKTGDAGYIDEDGHVIYLDRVKEMIRLANGESFSPQFIEGRLKFNPFIRDVMALGGPNRDRVNAMIIFDFENVGNWAEKNRIGYTTFADLSQKPEVYDLVHQAVQEVNENLPPKGRVERFVLMHKEFDADESEMTRSRKLKRNVLYERYNDIIEAMYSGKESLTVRAPVRYQDGREGFIETDLRIQTV